MPFLVFHPWSRYRIAWDLLVMLCLIENLLLVPFNLAFTETQRDKIDWVRGGVRKFDQETLDSIFWFEFAIDVAFLSDIMLNFMTAYVHINEKGDSELVTKRLSIAYQYSRGWFFIDLIGSVPLEFILKYGAGEDAQGGVSRVLRIFKLLRLLKLTRVWRLGRFINKLKDAFDFNPAVIRAFKMLVFFCLVAHALTCLLFWVGTIDNIFFTCVLPELDCSQKSCFANLATCMCNTEIIQQPDFDPNNFTIHAVDDPTIACEKSTWLREKWLMLPGDFKLGVNGSKAVTIEDMPVISQYQVTFYWVLATMATVGYGDLKPVTEYEIGVCIVSQIVGATTFGFIVGNMATLADLLKGRAGQFKEQMDNITNLLTFYNVPLSVRRRVTKDFNHQFHRPYAQVKTSIINVIPRALAVQVAKDVFRDILDGSPMFKGLPQSVRDQLYLCLQPRHFAPGEVVIRKDVLSSGVYLILTGHIHISDATSHGEGVDLPTKKSSVVERSSEMLDEESSKILLEAELEQQFLNEVDESKVLVTLVSGAMLGEECMLPTNLAMPFVAKAAEWIDVLYIDRRDIISLLTDNREALARIHLAARLRNERFRTLLEATKVLQRRAKNNDRRKSLALPSGRRTVPPLKTGDGSRWVTGEKSASRSNRLPSSGDSMDGPEAEARAVRLKMDPTEVLMVGGVRICELDMTEQEMARLANAANDFGEELEDGTHVIDWAEWMDGKGLAAGLLSLKSKHGSYEMAMQSLDKAQGAASKTKDRHVTLEDLPVVDDEGNLNEKGIESQLLELITRLDRLEARATDQHRNLFGKEDEERMEREESDLLGKS